jgi:hypothetical protein
MSIGENRLGAVTLVPYTGEEQLPSIQALIDRDLSEPYSVFTYRYFLLEWPHLCFLALEPMGDCVGTVVSKLVRKFGCTLPNYQRVLRGRHSSFFLRYILYTPLQIVCVRRNNLLSAAVVCLILTGTAPERSLSRVYSYACRSG